jgi:hypothetical protein
MFEMPFVGALGLALGFSLGTIYGRSRALAGFWQRIEARMRELNDEYRIGVRKTDGSELTLEAFVKELKG